MPRRQNPDMAAAFGTVRVSMWTRVTPKFLDSSGGTTTKKLASA